MLGCTYRH